MTDTGTPLIPGGNCPTAMEIRADWAAQRSRNAGDRKRLIVRMHDEDGLSFTAIARHLGMSRTGVAWHYHKAVAA